MEISRDKDVKGRGNKFGNAEAVFYTIEMTVNKNAVDDCIRVLMVEMQTLVFKEDCSQSFFAEISSVDVELSGQEV